MPVSSERLNVVAKLLRMLSFATGRTALANPAHPRSRGEHCQVLMASSPFWGSSPLARGTLSGFAVGLLASGLIPARAGNTVYKSGLGGNYGAHPRSRGEHPVD